MQRGKIKPIAEVRMACELIDHDAAAARTIVVEAKRLLTIPPHRNTAGLGNGHGHIANGLFAVIGRVTFGVMSVAVDAGATGERTVCPTAARSKVISDDTEGMKPTSSRDTTSSALQRSG